MLNLELQRRLRGLSQGEFAERVGVSSRYVSGVERGWLRPSERFRRSCSFFFGLPEEVLFSSLTLTVPEHRMAGVE